MYGHSPYTDNSLLSQKRSHIHQIRSFTENTSCDFSLGTVPHVMLCWVPVLLLVVKDCIRACLWKSCQKHKWNQQAVSIPGDSPGVEPSGCKKISLCKVSTLPLRLSAKALQIHAFSEGLFLKYVTDLWAFLLRIVCSLGLPFLTEFANTICILGVNYY